MPVNNIKISELNGFPGSILREDFIPIVDSSSMTTYRTDIGSIFSASIPITYVSYSLSSSHASNSYQSYYSTRSKDVDTYGRTYDIPYWSGSAGIGNGALVANTNTYISYSNLSTRGIVVIDHITADNAPYSPLPISRPDYILNNPYWNWKQNTIGGQGIYDASGIYTFWPIVSSTFCGTDQISWNYSSPDVPSSMGNNLLQYLTGTSSLNPSFINITSGLGGISTAFNKQWIRIATIGCNTSNIVSKNASYGETLTPANGFYGRIRLDIETNGSVNWGVSGSNMSQIVDMHIHNAPNGGGIEAHVFVGNHYGTPILNKLRLSVCHLSSSVTLPSDPVVALDIYMDNLQGGDNQLYIGAQSWGGVRFSHIPTVNPPVLVDTGSVANIIPQQQQAYLIFPPVAGHYSTLGDTQDYYLTGKNVVINPNRNEVTESNNVTKTNYSLNVSGTINTQNYYVGGHAGLNDIIVAYHPSDLQWYNMTMSSGMLIGSNSTTSPVVGGGITPGASYNISTSYASGSTSSSFSATASYIDYSNNQGYINHPAIPKAWGVVVGTSSLGSIAGKRTMHNPLLLNGYNIQDNVTMLSRINIPSSTQFGSFNSYGAGSSGHYAWGIQFITPMPNANYIVHPINGGETSYGQWIVMNSFPIQAQTIYGFTMSYAAGNASWDGSTINCDWFGFVVYSNP